MKISITDVDLDVGRAMTSLRNPLTCAISRLTGWSYAYQDGLLWPPAGRLVRVPDQVRNWLAMLAAGKVPATPREYSLDLPEPAGTDRLCKQVVAAPPS